MIGQRILILPPSTGIDVVNTGGTMILIDTNMQV